MLIAKPFAVFKEATISVDRTAIYYDSNSICSNTLTKLIYSFKIADSEIARKLVDGASYMS